VRISRENPRSSPSCRNRSNGSRFPRFPRQPHWLCWLVIRLEEGPYVIRVTAIGPLGLVYNHADDDPRKVAPQYVDELPIRNVRRTQ
jgi:hypothetical protein